MQPSSLSLQTVAPLKQVSLELFFASSGLAAGGRWGRSSKCPMSGAGWGLLAALGQDLPAHPVHLRHNHMLLLGDYVSVSSLCN